MMRIYSYSTAGYEDEICPWIIDINSTRKCGNMILGDAYCAVLEREAVSLNGEIGFRLNRKPEEDLNLQITGMRYDQHLALVSHDGKFEPNSTFVWRNFDMVTGGIYDSMCQKGKEDEFRLEDQMWMRLSDNWPAVIIDGICVPSNDSWLFRAIDSDDTEEISDMIFRGDARDFEPQIDVPYLKSVEELTHEFPKLKELYRQFEEMYDKEYCFTPDAEHLGRVKKTDTQTEKNENGRSGRKPSHEPER